MTPAKRYPGGPITPHGAYHLLHDKIPQVSLLAYDGSVVFNLMGALSINDRYSHPERVEVVDIKGLIPPWRNIDQKGATQDGTTFVDAMYDPTEITLRVRCRGRDNQHLREVVRDLIASLDAKKESELSWTTHAHGRWWASVRLNKTIDESLFRIAGNTYEFDLRLRVDNAFWQSHPDIDSFSFSYEDFTDTFNYVSGTAAPTTPIGAGSPGGPARTGTMGPNWPIYCTGTGGGFPRSNGSQAVWVDDPINPFFTGTRDAVIGPYKDFSTDTDNQVVNMVFGSFQEWSFPQGAANDLWARMGRNANGTWNGTGIRMRIENNVVKLSRFNNFSQTVMAFRPILIPPIPGEKFTFIAGVDDSPRTFKVQRNGIELMSHVENGTQSIVNSAHRGLGFGMQAGRAVITQATPAAIRKISGGDSTVVAQAGFLKRVNVGDQDYWDRYTCFGPGIFRFGNGPGSEDMVEFGPLLPNQIMQIRTDPRKYGVRDLTVIPASPQELNIFQKALQDFVSFATGNNVPPLLEAIQSAFGIAPPQGNPYSLLKGRFSRPVPARSPGAPVQPYYVKVEIDDGNASSMVLASGTPLRRYPL
jgi:predicted phage tail component-like protein